MERRLITLPEGLTAERLSLRANLALAQGFVARASEVEIRAEGEIRRIVRQAKLRKLICEVGVQEESGALAPVLRVSGPLSLFGHTTVYGKALAELVPLLTWCNRFSLSAVCRVRGKEARFEIRSGDPILPAPEPKLFDSMVERRFAEDFRAQAPDWELVREPEAFAVSGQAKTMIFPDFLVRHRRATQIQFYLEIVGYWTPDYLVKKLRGLQGAGILNLILCVDEALNCGGSAVEAELKQLGSVIFFKRRVPVLEVLSRMTQSTERRGQ